MSPVPLSVAPSRDTDGGIVGLSEVTHPDDNRIEVADGSQKRRPPIRTSAGGSSYKVSLLEVFVWFLTGEIMVLSQQALQVGTRVSPKWGSYRGESNRI